MSNIIGNILFEIVIVMFVPIIIGFIYFITGGIGKVVMDSLDEKFPTILEGLVGISVLCGVLGALYLMGYYSNMFIDYMMLPQ